MNNFRIAAANLLNAEPNIPQQILLLSFNSTLPLAARSYALQLNNTQTFLSLDNYLDALLSIIPECIRRHKTRSKSKRSSSKSKHYDKSKPDRARKHNKGPRKHHPTNKVVPTTSPDTSWMSGTFIEGPMDLQDSSDVGMAHVLPEETHELPQETTKWCLDSGSAKFICGNRRLLHKICHLEKPINFSSFVHSNTKSYEKGCFMMKFKGKQVILKNVYYVEGSSNLLSLGELSKYGITSQVTTNNELILSINSEIIYKAQNLNGIFYFDPLTIDHATNVTLDEEILNHFRFGHPSKEVSNMNKVNCSSKGFCNPCLQGQMNRKKIKNVAERRRGESSVPFNRIHIDSIGPLTITSNGHKYGVIVTDDCTSYRWFFGYSIKSGVPTLIRQMISIVETRCKYKVCYLHSDNGELSTSSFNNFLLNKGITLESTIPHTPEQNGVAEVANRICQNKARSLLMAAALPLSYWFFALQYAVVLLNRLPVVKNGSIPYESFYRRKVEISHLRVFGCNVMAKIPQSKTKIKKFDARATPGIFVGVATTSRGYLIYFQQYKCIKLCRSVAFNEKHLIFKALNHPNHKYSLDYETLFQKEIIVNLATTHRKLQHFDANKIPRSYRDIQNYEPTTRQLWLDAYSAYKLLEILKLKREPKRLRNYFLFEKCSVLKMIMLRLSANTKCAFALQTTCIMKTGTHIRQSLIWCRYY